MGLEPDARIQAGGTVPPDVGNASPAPPALDADVVVVQDGEDDDADDALSRPRKKGLEPGGLESVQEVVTSFGWADREDLIH
jgi:hypothetical protein